MNKKKKYTGKIILLVILTLFLAAEVAFILLDPDIGAEHLLGGTEPSGTQGPTDPSGDPIQPSSTEGPTEETTEEPTEETTEPPTEPQPEVFTLTFVGDCTLGSTSAKWATSSSFVQTVGENYDYPFANVVEYFKNDDFTIANLEVALTDSTSGAAAKRFAFRGPTAYTQILTGSSVEAVTLANNHSEDYGKSGYQDTAKALTEAGVTYVEHNNYSLHTTESGLTIGLYAASFSFTKSDIRNDIKALKNAGAEIVICAFHWGTEGAYRPNSNQTSIAHAAIDAGADIVYGHHPHVLQPIEYYGGGVIYYSLSNFSFGGSVFPQDYDTAVLQQQVIRDVDGTVRLGELTIIPCSISSMNGQNNYQPTPFTEGSKEYDRAMSKLDGTFTGPNLVVDYDKGTETTEPTAGETGGESGGETGSESAGETGGESGGETGGADTPANPPADTPADGGGSSEGGSSGGESSGGGDAPAGGSDAPAASGGET